MSKCDEINCGYYYKGEDDDFPCCHFKGWIAPCECEDDYKGKNKIKIAECPYCKEELKIDESYEIDVEDIDEVTNRVTGHCPNCNKEFQWEEIYKYSYFSNLEEV